MFRRFPAKQQKETSSEIEHVTDSTGQPRTPSGPQFTILPTGSDNPDHRKRLTQPQDVISTGDAN